MPWPAFRQEAIASLALLVLALGTVWHAEAILWPRISLLMFGLATIPPLQWATGLIYFLDDAILASLYLILFGLAIGTGASLAASHHRRHAVDGFAGCLLFASIVSAGMAMCQWLGPAVWAAVLDDIPNRGRPFANFGQPNQLSTHLLLGLASLLYWYETKRINGWCASIATIWLGWGVVITQSRSAWLAIGVLVVWFTARRRRCPLRLHPAALSTGVGLFMIATLAQGSLWAMWHDPSSIDSASTFVRSAIGTRPVHWAGLWHAVTLSPWIGYGWGEVARAQFTGAAFFPPTGEWLDTSHNLVLDLLIYNGIPAGLVIVAMLGAWLLRRMRDRDAGSWCWIFALLVMFSHAMVEDPLHFLYLLLPAGLLMGGMNAQTAFRARGLRRILSGVIVMLATSLAIIASEYVKAEEAWQDMRLSTLGIGTLAGTVPASDWLILQSWAEYLHAMSIEVRENMARTDLDTLHQTAMRLPYPVLLAKTAHASALNGRVEIARAMLLHACKVHHEGVCRHFRTWWKELREASPAVRSVEFPDS